MLFINKISVWNDTVRKCNYLSAKGLIPDPSIKYDYLECKLEKNIIVLMSKY
jgi:hypothetical protein